MGGAILLGACLTGLQGHRGPLGWELPAPSSRLPGSQGARELAPTEPAATTVPRYDVSSQGAGEPASTKPAATTTVRRYNASSQGAGEPALMEPVKTTVRRHFHHVL